MTPLEHIHVEILVQVSLNSEGNQFIGFIFDMKDKQESKRQEKTNKRGRKHERTKDKDTHRTRSEASSIMAS